MNNLSKISSQSASTKQILLIEIDENSAGQRIDNFLFRHLKGVPKSHIYRILRSGEVRVNKGRIDAAYRLVDGDKVRIPPIRMAETHPDKHAGLSKKSAIAFSILYEDDALLAIDKPAGIAVHGGSGVSHGVIEQLRHARPQAKFLELVHRLDRETSGILLVAKKRSALIDLHRQLRENLVDKRYLACVHADWREPRRVVKDPLHKYLTAEGERRVCVHPNGQSAHTVFNLVQRYAEYALLEAELKTGRTHQIRVHLAHLGAPIAGDDKYGDFALNRELARSGACPGLKRMFLHAFKVRFKHPLTGQPLVLEAPLPAVCQQFLSACSSFN